MEKEGQEAARGLSITLTTPPRADQREIQAVSEALQRAGTPVTRELVQLRESAEVGPEVFWLAVGAAGYALKKLADPSLDEVGTRIRDLLFGAPAAARAALPERIDLEVWIELAPETEVMARYWLPSGDQRPEAELSLLDHYRIHPTGDVDRYWYRDVGWLRADEVHARMRE